MCRAEAEQELERGEALQKGAAIFGIRDPEEGPEEGLKRVSVELEMYGGKRAF